MSPAKVDVKNRHRFYRLNTSLIRRLVSLIKKALKKPLKMELEVIFLDEDAMTALNKTFKNKDRPTDVLSFELGRREFGLKRSMGEIFISLDAVCENAKIFKTDFGRELALYLIHGILHLSGYEDSKSKARLKMAKKEDEILNRICESEDLSKVLMRR